jgi:hypothetical protein
MEINFTGKISSEHLNGKKIINIFPYDSIEFWEYMKIRNDKRDTWFFAELSIENFTIEVIIIQEK